MPSIAITKPNIGLSGFGDITLIGSKEVIDPQRTGTNKVYGADAYTPRYPNVVYTIGDKNALNNALKDIKDESIKNDIISGIENHIEREGILISMKQISSVGVRPEQRGRCNSYAKTDLPRK